MPVVEDLLSQGILTEETYSQIMRAKTSKEQMKELFKAIDEGGNKVKSAFYNVVHEPQLIPDVGKDETSKPFRF